MPLRKTPNLDDRTFQSIVDDAKRKIPLYCPEWTDHNVSDPGVTLIELFAWMTELLLYRVNQVPDVMYVRFLEMLGITLESHQAATVPVTFYVTPVDAELRIDQDTEVATLRTANEEPVVFTTLRPLTIAPGRLLREPLIGSALDVNWRRNLRALPEQRLFEQRDGSAFYLLFDRNYTRHVLELDVRLVQKAVGVGTRAELFAWEVAQTEDWARCDVEQDATGNFNDHGVIRLRLPEMNQQEIIVPGEDPLRAFVLRCRLLNALGEVPTPSLDRLTVRTVGGTVEAANAIVARDEVLGRSTGQPGQAFQLLHTPILPRASEDECLVVEHTDGHTEIWDEVEHFAFSSPDAPHYMLDRQSGMLTFGPALPQTNGAPKLFGKAPPSGSLLRLRRYRYSGGVRGNVRTGTITVLKTALPYVRSVYNWRDAAGGRDAESLDLARMKAVGMLRSRERAVTADDYEFLAGQVRGVAATRCIGVGRQPEQPGSVQIPPGQVNLYVLPEIEFAPPERVLTYSALLEAGQPLLAQVRRRLEPLLVLGTVLQVLPPRYFCVELAVKIGMEFEDGRRDRVRREVEAVCHRFFSPYVPDSTRSPFGRTLYRADLEGLLRRVDGVTTAEVTGLTRREEQSEAVAERVPNVVLPLDALAYLGRCSVEFV